MKKHILGFALFSFIVAAAAFVYKSFNSVVTEETYNSNYSTRCKRLKLPPETSAKNMDVPFVRQAVLDTQTKILHWKLYTPKMDAAIKLHFFVKDENAIRYISSAPGIRSALKGGELNFESSWMWMDNLDSYEDLYVVAEAVSPSEIYYKKIEPKFDAGKATAISLYWGK